MQKFIQKRKGVRITPWSVTLCVQIIFMLTYSINSGFAQQLSSDPNFQPQQKVETVKVVSDKPSGSVVPTSDQVTPKPSVTDLPYYNYKGISDLELAKEAWVKDHPDEYNKVTGQKVTESQVTQKPAEKKVVPKPGEKEDPAAGEIGFPTTPQK